ncbi:MAG TPA: hypothetical protein VHE35_30475 [Kofleriaceae bacterium]|nr:hypothetical protein [Kofleriaceae bacterium]
MRAFRCGPALAGACTLALAAALGGARPAAADPVEKGAFGVGLVIGEPTGLSARLYLRDDQAIQAALGLSAVVGGFQVHADYVFHPIILEERDAFTLPAYIGPGLSLLQHAAGRDGDDDFRIGVRAVAGLLFDFKELPLDVFAEVAAVGQYTFGSESDSVNGFGVALNGGLGARYYF